MKVRHKQFELGDKPGPLLSRQLRGAQASRAIHEIKSQTSSIVTAPVEINKCFRDFYENLYKSQSSAAEEDVLQFLRSLPLPKIDCNAQNELNAEITLQEVAMAIKEFPSGKSPGPDGLGIDFYKAFIDDVAPLLLRMIKESIKNKKLADSLYMANISLILKKDKDQTDPSSYRPIALLGSDLKVFTKILANRLNKHVATIIHPDQVGYIPRRFSFFNVRRLLNIVYCKQNKSKSAVLTLDAHKAFDQVDWKYMLLTIREFGLGESFSSWVEMLYAPPTASVLTNSDRSHPFNLYRGVRQGCRLSPLLFALCIEPLAVSIRCNHKVIPIHLGKIDNYIALYADDVILFLSQPEKSIPPLLNQIKNFGKL